MAEEVAKSEQPVSSEQHGDLMGSAKILAEAAQSGGKDIDKAKVAGAAEDVLEAAKTYGKLDESSGVGQYLGQAEGYLHKYHSSNDSSAPPHAVEKPHGGEEGEKDEEVKSKSGAGAGADADAGAGGASDVINMAKKGLGGFFS